MHDVLLTTGLPKYEIYCGSKPRGMIMHSEKGKCNVQVMDKCTNLRAADKGAATRPKVRANDIRPVYKGVYNESSEKLKLNLLLPLLLDFSGFNNLDTHTSGFDRKYLIPF